MPTLSPSSPSSNPRWEASSNTRGLPANSILSFFVDRNYVRPNKYDPKYKEEGEQYHLDNAKWALFDSYDSRHMNWLDRIKRNKRFYMGDQWEGEEDLEAFLKDETGASRNRIKVKINQIRPMVEQYRGNAIRLALGARAKSVSNNAKNRREQMLEEVLFTTEISREFQALGELIRKHDALIGETPPETERNFDNIYVDKYVDKMNKLLRFSAELNEMEGMQIKVAESLVFSGIGCIEEFEHGGHLRKEAFDPEELIFDRNARRYDLQDGAYKGRLNLVAIPIILEKYQGVTMDERKALLNYSSLNMSQNGGNSAPVAKIFWRDFITKEYGWVKDEFGYPYHAELNVEDELSEGRVYTDKDLITPPDSPENRRLYKNGAKKRKMVVDIVRYCVFIPGEAIGYYEDNEKKKAKDIVLEWGPYEYQETNWLDLSNSKYPIKSYAWAYLDGELIAPIDDIIDPQRLMNRIMSAIESQINNSGGSGVFYSKDALDDGPDEEARLQRAIKMGKPFGFRDRGKGLPNTTIPYDDTIKAGTYNMFGLFPQLKTMIQDTTGVNEGLKGESTGSDQLVGVTQLMIQRGSLMQEPFYDAIAKVFVQSHQSTATIGKRIYINNQRELSIIVGDDGVETFKLSEGMRNEDFRVFIKRDASLESIQQQADAALTILLQSQLISKSFFVEHWGRSSVDEIQAALRVQAKRESIASIQALKEQEKAILQASQEETFRQQKAAEAAERATNDALIMDQAKDERNKAHDLEKIVVQEAAKSGPKA